MEGESTLQLVAELAIGVMGFSGIVAVLGRRATGVWSQLDRTRFMAMVRQTVFVLFLCLLPLALIHTGLSLAWVWGSSSAAGAVLALALPAVLRDSRPAFDFRWLWSNSEVGKFALIYGAGVMVAVPLVLGLNALGLLFPRAVGPYLVAVLLQFGVPITLFVRLLRSAIASPQPE